MDYPTRFDLRKDGHSCFGSPIDAETAIFQISLHDRDLDLVSDSSPNKGRIELIDEEGRKYDVAHAAVLGKLTLA